MSMRKMVISKRIACNGNQRKYLRFIQQFLLTLRDKKHKMDFTALSHILLLVHAIHGIYYGDVNLN